MSNEDERRRGDRIPGSGEANLQIIESADTELDGLTFQSYVVDLSPGGLRLRCDRSIEGCKLDLWIKLDGQPEKVFLMGEVRWVRSIEGDSYQAGVQITDNPLTDFERWRKLFSRAISQAR